MTTISNYGRPGFNPWIRKIPWRRKWQPTPVFLPGKFHWRRSLVGYSSWGRKESDMTEWLHFHFHTYLLDFNLVKKKCISSSPGTAEPGALLSMGSHRVGHNWNDLAAAAVIFTNKSHIVLRIFVSTETSLFFWIFAATAILFSFSSSDFQLVGRTILKMMIMFQYVDFSFLRRCKATRVV